MSSSCPHLPGLNHEPQLHPNRKMMCQSRLLFVRKKHTAWPHLQLNPSSVRLFQHLNLRLHISASTMLKKREGLKKMKGTKRKKKEKKRKKKKNRHQKANPLQNLNLFQEANPRSSYQWDNNNSNRRCNNSRYNSYRTNSQTHAAVTTTTPLKVKRAVRM